MSDIPRRPHWMRHLAAGLAAAGLALAAATAAPAQDATEAAMPWGEPDWPQGWQSRDLPAEFATETRMRLFGTGIDCEARPCPYWVAVDEASGEMAVVTDVDTRGLDDPAGIDDRLDALTGQDGAIVVGTIVERPTYPGQIGSPTSRILILVSIEG